MKKEEETKIKKRNIAKLLTVVTPFQIWDRVELRSSHGLFDMARLVRIASSEIRFGSGSFMLGSHLTKSNLEHKLYIFIIYKIKKIVKIFSNIF
jgi:hypothetical protein